MFYSQDEVMKHQQELFKQDIWKKEQLQDEVEHQEPQNTNTGSDLTDRPQSSIDKEKATDESTETKETDEHSNY